jgi:hypothetical protein
MPAFTIELPNGKRLGVEADDENAALSGAQEWYKQNVTDKTDTSLTSALTEGMVAPVAGIGSTIKNLVSKDAGQAVMDAAASKQNPKYKSAYESFANPEDGADKHFMGLDWSSAPRALLEQAPSLAMDLATQAALKKLGPVAQVAGGVVTHGLRTAGNEIQKRATARTGDDNADPSLEDKAVGVGSTLLQGALNSYGANKIINPSKVTGTGLSGIAQTAGNAVKAAAAEGATSGAQALISEGAAKAGTDAPIDTKDAIAQAALGTLGGGAFHSLTHGVKDTAQALRTTGTDYGDHSSMAAKRILEKVAKPSELENPEKAFAATKGAITDVRTEFSDAAKNVTAPSQETANAIARVKSGDALTAKELSAIDAEGNDTLSSLARQATALRKLTDHGTYDESQERFAGGAGEAIRRLVTGNKIASLAATAVPNVAHNGMAGMDSLMSALPGMAETAAGGYGAYKLLRLGERAAGISSPARAFTDKFGNGDQVRPNATPSPMAAAGVSVPKVTPQNSLTTPQPWGPTAPKPTPFKPDMLDSNIQKIVEKLQNQKRRDTAQQAMPLLRQLAAQNQPAPAAPGPDVNAMNEQVKSALLMASARRKIAGQQQAEAEAADSHAINEAGGLEALRNPAFGKRGSELLQAANVMQRLRRVPEVEGGDAPVQPQQPQGPFNFPQQPPQAPQPAPQPVAPQPAPQPAPAQPSPAGGSIIQQALAVRQAQRARDEQAKPTSDFVLPESPYFHHTPEEAAKLILRDALVSGKQIDHPENYRDATAKRLQGEEEIYNNIVGDLPTKEEKRAFHEYLSAMWGSDSPAVMRQTKAHMLAAMPARAAIIEKHLTEDKIKALWQPKRKKK